MNEQAWRLRAARERLGLSKRQLAKLARIHRPSYVAIEQGKINVGLTRGRRLARALRVKLAWILLIENDDRLDPLVDLLRRQAVAEEGTEP